MQSIYAHLLAAFNSERLKVPAVKFCFGNPLESCSQSAINDAIMSLSISKTCFTIYKLAYLSSRRHLLFRAVKYTRIIIGIMISLRKQA